MHGWGKDGAAAFSVDGNHRIKQDSARRAGTAGERGGRGSARRDGRTSVEDEPGTNGEWGTGGGGVEYRGRSECRAPGRVGTKLEAKGPARQFASSLFHKMSQKLACAALYTDFSFFSSNIDFS